MPISPGHDHCKLSESDVITDANTDLHIPHLECADGITGSENLTLLKTNLPGDVNIKQM